jgi:hypothetical protein
VGAANDAIVGEEKFSVHDDESAFLRTWQAVYIPFLWNKKVRDYAIALRAASRLLPGVP